MSESVFIVSEWLAKPGCEAKLFKYLQELIAQTLKNEPGCIRAHVTRPIAYPGLQSDTKFPIVLLQEYKNMHAFEAHCQQEYIVNFFKTQIDDPTKSWVEDWRCRLLAEADQ